MFEAKPNLNDRRGIRQFETKKEAVKYLEEYTGIEMSWERDKKTKEVTYDWELIGKLYSV